MPDDGRHVAPPTGGAIDVPDTLWRRSRRRPGRGRIDGGDRLRGARRAAVRLLLGLARERPAVRIIGRSHPPRAEQHALSDLAWPAVGARVGPASVLAIPLGATEQHGPHLPGSVDTDLAVTLCAGLARAAAEVLVAPALPYGASGEHAGFPGTLSIGHEALVHVLVELGRSATDTVAHVLYVSAHGGNGASVRTAVATLRAEGRDVEFFEPRWAGEAHAGRTETSMLLALDPARVRMDLAEAGETRPLEALMPQLRAGGVRGVSPSGVLGDPRGATAEEGAELLARLVADLVAHVAAWRSRTSEGASAITPGPSDVPMHVRRTSEEASATTPAASDATKVAAS